MLNIVIPLAGLGKRFQEKGYSFPKPLIEIKGKPMVQWVAQNLCPRIDHRFIFICRREHYNKYNLGGLLNLIAPDSPIVVVDGLTAGAACTVLLAKEYINNDEPLMIANSDQYVDISIDDFISAAKNDDVDGLIMTFKATHPKWSFAKVGKDGFVDEVAEKNPISDNATVGIYYYKHGKYFVEAAEDMIRKDIRTNNEFYVCPTYNEMILRDKKIKIYEIPGEKMFGWGTPEDLEYFLTTPFYKAL